MKPTTARLRPLKSDRSFIGLDIGGTKIHGIRISDTGHILASATIPTLAAEGSDAVAGRIFALIEELISASGVAAIGLGVPGPLDTKAGTILKTENLPFEDFPLAELVEHRFGIPTLLENDGATAAFGEYLFGPARGANPLLYLTASTGIGAGLVIDGKLYRGKTGNALEAGHIPLLAGEGPPCACGGRGCVEALVSGKAIAAQAREAVRAARLGKAELTGLAALPEQGPKEVFALAEKGDVVSERIVTKALYYFGYCAVTLVTLFDPETLVIGGGLVRAGGRIKAAVEAAISLSPIVAAGTCKVISPGLGDDAGALGAAALAAENFIGENFILRPRI